MTRTLSSHPAEAETVLDPREPAQKLLRDLRSGPRGLAEREAARRLDRYGPNELRFREGSGWPRALARQFTHPLAVLLMPAAVLAYVTGSIQLAWAILAVVVVNAAFAFVQERQAGKAVEALGRYLPPHSQVRRDGAVRVVPATEIVPGDLLLLAEGDRVPADGRLLSGAVMIDASAVTGESAPVDRIADAIDVADRMLDSPVLVFSGTSCVGARPRRWCSRQAATPRSAGSPRWPAAARRATAHWSARSAASPT
jgi:magnesium-transporting ATPase (P-type)